jgi:hypothetical protein
VSKLRLNTHAIRSVARAALALVVAALLFGPMSGCYATARPGYYSSGYYGGRGYRGPDRYYYPRERHRHYRAPDAYRGGYGRHHHREHHHRHPRW